jgi:imidazolonepropionase
MKVDLLAKNATELITPKGSCPKIRDEMNDLCIIRDGAIAVKHGKIMLVGDTKSIEKKVDSKTIIDCSDKIIIPGLVDPHTHLVFAGSRENELKLKLEGKSYIEILEAGGGIFNTVKSTRDAPIESLIRQGLKRLNTMMEYGTTTIEIKSGYGLSREAELKIINVIKMLGERHPMDIVPTFLGAHAIPPDDTRTRYINTLISMLSYVRTDFCDIFCENGVFTIEDAKKLLTHARKYMKLKLHADEFTQFGGAELSAELSATSADHLLMTSDIGFKRMAEKRVVGVLLPATSFALMENRYADARKMINYGIPIAIGTDFNPNCWVESMQFVMTLACYQLKMSVSEIITASTLNAAYAIGKHHIVGSLESGKKGDFLVLDVPNHLNICYRFGTNLVEKVVKNGVIVIDKNKKSSMYQKYGG